jgi:hypothetical protein
MTYVYFPRLVTSRVYLPLCELFIVSVVLKIVLC